MIAIYFGRCAFGMGAAALFAGCGAPIPASPQGQPVTSGYASAAGPASKGNTDPWLYVAGNASNNVVIYDLAKPGFPEVGSLSTGISSPGGIALDKKGDLYVANASGTVTVYPPGKTVPKKTLSDRLTMPESIAVDPSGNIYVCNRGSVPSIVVFRKGKSKASLVITDRLIQVPAQIALDAAGDLFYADNNTGVSEIRFGTSGSQTMVSLKLKDLQRTDGLAVDPTDGNLFVSTFGNELDGVRVYATHFKKPIRTLRDAAGADFSAAGAVNKGEFVFIPDHYNNTVKAFRSNSHDPAYAIDTSAARHSVGVAVKPSGVP
jgi:sugar lactone lactonase YvrE